MEVVAQWLDDLDDLVFVLPLAWERMRFWCLNVGLASALTLCAIEIGRVFIDWALTFALVALGSVIIWILGLVAVEIADLRAELARASVPPGL